MITMFFRTSVNKKGLRMRVGAGAWPVTGKWWASKWVQAARINGCNRPEAGVGVPVGWHGTRWLMCHIRVSVSFSVYVTNRTRNKFWATGTGSGEADINEMDAAEKNKRAELCDREGTGLIRPITIPSEGVLCVLMQGQLGDWYSL